MGGQWRYGMLVALAGAVVSGGGCAGVVDGPMTTPLAVPTSVSVENNKWLDVNVFAVRGGRKTRLGMVTSMTSREFDLPSWTMAGSGDLQLLIDPIGSSQTQLLGPIVVSGGERVELRVANEMALSAYMVRSRR